MKTAAGDKVFSETFPVRRGVVQGDIFSPLCFIVALEAIFRRHDCGANDGIKLPCTEGSVTQGDGEASFRPLGAKGFIKISQLAYADDADLICKDCNEATRRVTSISVGSREDADMNVHKVKTEVQTHERATKLPTPTEDEIAEVCEHVCEFCNREFSSYFGKRVHQARWCGEAETELFEDEYKVKAILDAVGTPQRRFYLVDWDGYNDTGEVVKGDKKRGGRDTAPGERWAETWEPAHHLSDAPIPVDAFWEKHAATISRNDTIADATVSRCEWCCQICKNQAGIAVHHRTCRSKPGSRNGSKSMKAAKRKQQADLQETKEKVYIEGVALPSCFVFPYLGHQFQADGDPLYDIEVRMARARTAFGKMRHIWNNKTVPLALKIQLYKSGVCSVLTYAHETWTLDEATCRKLNGWNCKCLVAITGWEYREEATEPTFDLVATLRARRLRWLGHILRMPDHRLVRRVALRQGTPATNSEYPAGTLFMDAPTHSSVDELVKMARDREGWRKHVHALQPGKKEEEEDDDDAEENYCWEVSRSLVKKLKKRMGEAEYTATELAKLAEHAVVFYTDGGCDGNGAGGVWGKAGWGAVAMKRGESGEREVVDELWGSVETDPESPFYLGATIGSNNTGELIGIAQALIWLRDVDAGHAPAAICYDSEYAARITQGIYKPKKNRDLSLRCQKLLKEECARRKGGVTFIHVKGHSGDIGNDRADLLVQWGKEKVQSESAMQLKEAEPESVEQAAWRKRVWKKRLQQEAWKSEREEKKKEEARVEREERTREKERKATEEKREKRDMLRRMANISVMTTDEEWLMVSGVDAAGVLFEVTCVNDAGGPMVGLPKGSPNSMNKR